MARRRISPTGHFALDGRAGGPQGPAFVANGQNSYSGRFNRRMPSVLSRSERRLDARLSVTGRGVRQARWAAAAESGTGSGCGYQLGRLEARRSTNVANGKTMSVPISALTTPPQSKMLVSPMPRPTVKMR